MRRLLQELRRLLEARPIPIDKAAARKLAKKVMSLLPQHLQFRWPAKLPAISRTHWKLDRQWGFSPLKWEYFVGTYALKDVRGRDVVVPVYVGARKGTRMRQRYFFTGGHVAAFAGSGRKAELRLFIDSERSVDELLSNPKMMELEAYSILIHEITHLRDELASYSQAASDTVGSKRYYNEPAEVRAYMQQIVDEVVEYLHELGKDDGGWLFVGRPSSDFIDSTLEKAPTWERVRRDLLPKNQRLILKAVARAVTDEWPKLQKLYPDDMLDA